MIAVTALVASAEQLAAAESAIPATKAPAASARTQESPYRLSENVSPSKYELEFVPDAEKGKFSGQEDIEMQVKKACTSIVMNAVDLMPSSAQILSEKNSAMPLQVKLDKSLERVSFLSAKPIAPGKYHLKCSFDGTLNDKLVGFYRSTFKDKQGKPHYLAVTQLESTDARRMFPCFDEPAFKSVFKIKAKIPKNQTAISNAPVEKESIDEASSKKIVEFEETPRMSSYLLALLIGEFKSTELLESEGVPIKVWSVEPHDQTLGIYARDNAAKLLKYLNAYFGINYPWKKLDLIAIPDFQAGAMENPGAITFREKFLLLDEKKSSLSTRQDTVSIIAHEMAHLWFGDLVTMKWWDDIWLNEAFATWMAKKATDAVHPEWDAMSEFYGNRLKAFFTDSLHATRSIQSPVIKPEDAEQMFDEITYVKGASVLRMLEHYLGANVFQNGVTAYLKEHAFGNATTNDLWSALQKSSAKPVKQIMDTWCKQPGYPLIQVKTDDAGKLKVDQSRFFLDGGRSELQTWIVPMGLRELDTDGRKNSSEAVKSFYELLSHAGAAIALSTGNNNSDKSKPACVSANASGNGFYRIDYPAAISKLLAKKYLGSMTDGERLCFLSDHAALAIAGRIPVQNYLDLLKDYKSETNYAVLGALIDYMQQIHRFVDPAVEQSFAKMVRFVLNDEYKLLGWEPKVDEPVPARLARARVFEALGTFGQDADVIGKARKQFADYLQNPASANPELLDAITHVVAYNGTNKDFEAMKKLWQTAKTPEQEHRNLYALALFRNEALVRATLELMLSKEVRSQDAPKIIGELFANDAANTATWNFVKSHWAQIKKQFAPHMLAKLSEGPASLTSPAVYADVKAFFSVNKVSGGASSIARMLEKLRINVQFNQRCGKELNAWLKANVITLD